MLQKRTRTHGPMGKDTDKKVDSIERTQESKAKVTKVEVQQPVQQVQQVPPQMAPHQQFGQQSQQFPPQQAMYAQPMMQP